MSAANPRLKAKAMLLAACAATGIHLSTSATTYTWSHGATDSFWTTPANWKGSVAPPTVPPAGDVTDLLYSGTLGLSQTRGIQDGGNYYINSITFDTTLMLPSSSSIIITATGTAPAPPNQNIHLGAGGIQNLKSDVRIQPGDADSRVILDADQTWITVSRVTLDRRVESSFTLTKTGTGFLQFNSPTSNPDFTGTLDLRQGHVELRTTNQFPNLGGVVAVSDDGVDFDGREMQSFACPILLGGLGGFGARISLINGSILFSNTVTLLNEKPLFGNMRFTGDLTGPGGIRTFETLTLEHSNSYAGTTTIAAGTLSIGSFTQLGTSTTPIEFVGSNSPATLKLRTNADTSRALHTQVGGRLNLAADITINNSISGPGSFEIAGTGKVTTDSVQIGGRLFINTNASLRLKTYFADSPANAIGSLLLTGSPGAWNSKFDITDCRLMMDYTGTSPLATVVDQVKRGFEDGHWSGYGINSSMAAIIQTNPHLPHKSGIGYGEASTLGISSFGGRDVDGTSLLLRYTFLGDVNLDGVVNAIDFNAMAANFGASGAFWFNGDFNYDGNVNTADFNALVANFNLRIFVDSYAGPEVLTPDPCTAGFAALLTASLVARRRKSRA